jgi:rare lipoprotein A
VTRVRVEYAGPASLAGSDDRALVASLRHHGPAPAPRVMLASAKPFVPRGEDARGERTARKPAPVPRSRPFSSGEEESEPVVEARKEREPAPRSGASELTAAARIERTMGRAPTMAWVTGPSGVPSSGVLRAAEPVSSFAPKGGGTNAAFMSGRGLY